MRYETKSCYELRAFLNCTFAFSLYLDLAACDSVLTCRTE